MSGNLSKSCWKLVHVTTFVRQKTTTFDTHVKPLIYFHQLHGSVTMDLTITVTQNTAAVWVPCYAMWPQANLWNANFIWIVSFNRLQKWVGESEGLVHGLLSGHRGSWRQQPVALAEGKRLQLCSSIEIHLMLKYIKSDAEYAECSAFLSTACKAVFFFLVQCEYIQQ